MQETFGYNKLIDVVAREHECVGEQHGRVRSSQSIQHLWNP